MAHYRKSKLIEQRLVWYKDYLIEYPWELRGQWRERFGQAQRIHLDLGCGKGVWTTRVATANPHELFIGMDCERMCISFAVERAAAEQLSNVVFIHNTAHDIESLFATQELDVMHVNFPTPFPRKKEALNRVTDVRRLMAYRSLLGESGEFHLKTDSQPFFDWTLEQLEAASYHIAWLTRDLHGTARDPKHHTTSTSSAIPYEQQNPRYQAETTDLTLSAYEEKFLPQNARIHALMALPGPKPATWTPSAKVSLVEYLPEDLESIAYVPHGMQGTVENMRNRKRNEQRKQRP